MNSFGIHAHFYQPPREDPLTGHIQIEPGAAPYSNWNERIHAECYRPNVQLKNFEMISFNIGPTLLSWMEKYDPETSRSIYLQDHANFSKYGSGNALAQAYNHTILPLGTYEDKVTQIYWGIADFIHRFHRKPKGMWLPETAVDMETLEVLALHGIRFTILAPWQADAASIDSNHPYRVDLGRNRDISIFFFQQELSGMVSFDPQTTINADFFARDLLAKHFNSKKSTQKENQMILIASDGELYGHHQQQREYFLEHLMDGASIGANLQPTYLERWLSQNPANEVIKIKEKTSWSCHHGIGRWTGMCACTPGNPKWKQLFRSAMDHLADTIDKIYIQETASLINDPWKLRDRYIHVLLGQTAFKDQLAELKSRELSSSEEQRLHLLIEAQRERQRMFTSCGWFFEDLDRIEPRNNIAYAAQAVRLIRLASGIDLEKQVRTDLESVVSQRSQLSAATLFENHLRRSEGIQEIRMGYAD